MFLSDSFLSTFKFTLEIIIIPIFCLCYPLFLVIFNVFFVLFWANLYPLFWCVDFKLVLDLLNTVFDTGKISHFHLTHKTLNSTPEYRTLCRILTLRVRRVINLGFLLYNLGCVVSISIFLSLHILYLYFLLRSKWLLISNGACVII